MLQDIRAARLEMDQAAQRVLGAARSFSQTAALELVHGPFESASVKLVALLDAVGRNVDRIVEEARSHLREGSQWAWRLTTLALIAALASVGFGLWLMRRQLVQPILGLTGDVLRIRESGRLDIEHDANLSGRHDEVGTLAKSFYAMLGELAGARRQLIATSEAEIAKQAGRLQTALSNMAQGLCLFDNEQRVVVANQRYAEMYGLPLESVRPGTTLREILQARVARGVYTDVEGQKFVEQGVAGFRREVSEILALADGRFIAVMRRPLANGGLVSTHEDITERQRLHAQVEKQNHLLTEHEQLLQLQNLQFDAALANMSQGLCMFDAEQRLVVCNDRYLHLYGLRPEQVTLGKTTLRDIVQMRIDNGLYAGATPAEYMRERIAPVLAASDVTHVLSDGRVIGHLAPADAERRLGRNARGHHRTAPLGGQDRAHGAARRPDRPAEPRADAREARARPVRRAARGSLARRAHARPRSLQGGERHARPPGRRCTAEGGSRAPARLRAGDGYGGAPGRRRVRHRPVRQ